MTIIRTDKPLQPRRDNELYETPEPLAVQALELLPEIRPRRILDPGAGGGVWGRAARRKYPKAEIWGVENSGEPKPPEYDTWWTHNYLSDNYEDRLREQTLIIGNPPYGDVWEEEQKRVRAAAQRAGQPYEKPTRPLSAGPYADAEIFVRRSLQLLKTKGHLIFLLRLAFLESQTRGNGLWQQYPPKEVHVLVERPSFTGNGKTDETAYAIYIWQKGVYGNPTLHWLSWR